MRIPLCLALVACGGEAPQAIALDVELPGMEAAWRLDEGAGTAISDITGHAHDGLLLNGVGWSTPGFINGALAFDGIDDETVIAHAPTLDAYPLSVAAWFKTAATSGTRGIVNKYVASSYNGYQLFMSGGKLCAWYLRDAANHVFDGTGCTFAVTGLADNRWHQAVFTVDAGGGKLYVDGALRGARAWSGVAGATTTSAPLRLGRYPGLSSGPGVFQGAIDEVRVYARALDAGEVSELRARDLARAADVTPPAVSLTAPAPGAALAGTIELVADAWDALELADVQLQLDGVNLGPPLASTPFLVSWDTRTTCDGPHTLRAIAHDGAGHATISAAVTVSVDNTPPAIAVTSPAAGSALRAAVTLGAAASDGGGLAGVSFRVDGVALGPEDLVAPYAVAWDTATASAGLHVLSAAARDLAGNVTLSPGVAVTVDNVAPQVAVVAPAGDALLAGALEVRAVASDDVAVIGVQLTIDGAPLGGEAAGASCARVWDPAGADGLHLISATARDAAGNLATAAAVAVTIDNQPPTAAVTAPAPGAKLSGPVTLVADAGDERGVASVRFELDGAALEGELTAPPYALTWDTTGTATGAHAIVAVATDRAGNRASSAAVQVSVSRYRFVDLTDPARVEARDLGGRRVATFTVGARTVATVGPTRTLSEQTAFDPVLRSVTHTTWVRLLPAAFAGDVDPLWLDAALAANDGGAPDVLAIAVQYIETAPPLLDGALQIAGNADYGPLQPDGTRAEGSDFHDYLGIPWTFAEAAGPLVRPADADQLRSLDCSGLVRMVFGYRGGLPLSFNPQPGDTTLPRRANELYERAPGAIIIANAGVQSTAYDRLQPGDTLYWDQDPDDGPRLDHVGIYLGVDPAGYHRFISSRKSANGPTLGDYVARSVLNRTGIYTTAFRAARRF